MKLYSEEQILDPIVRKEIIKAILDTSNQKRKNEAKRRHEVYKDQTIKYVMKKLQNEGLKPATLTLMENRASNISIAKKVVNKLAKCYKDGVRRDAGSDQINLQVDLLNTMLQFTSSQKKVDRYLRLQKNALAFFLPEAIDEGKFVLKMKVFSPWQYDAIENPKDPDCPIGIILSDFYNPQVQSVITGGANQTTGIEATGPKQTVGRDPAPIAEGYATTEAMPAEQYIFWGNKYHFTMDKNGQIINAISPEGLLNPIGMFPGVTMAKERDDGFWAGGGDDLIDGAILINTQITDMNAILFMQGWGQLVITGPKGSVPKQMETGPHHAMVLTYNPKKGEQMPKVDVVSSNPPIDAWMQAIEQYCALLLSTNNLAPGAISGKLDATNFPSGIAMLFEHSESTEDVEDAQHEFAVAERKEWKVIAGWYNYLYDRNALNEDWSVVGRLPEPGKLEVVVKFNPANQFIPESERLDNMRKKKDLGITTQLDMLMQENPGMTEEEATAKLMEIKKEQEEAAARMAKEFAANQPPGGQNENQQ